MAYIVLKFNTFANINPLHPVFPQAEKNCSVILQLCVTCEVAGNSFSFLKQPCWFNSYLLP